MYPVAPHSHQTNDSIGEDFAKTERPHAHATSHRLALMLLFRSKKGTVGQSFPNHSILLVV